ncbi:hypothetical protein [Streptomyces sp. ISL-96]|nr:hypothetical protein [Streptomyces sp. ISL-96]
MLPQVQVAKLVVQAVVPQAPKVQHRRLVLSRTTADEIVLQEEEVTAAS